MSEPGAVATGPPDLGLRISDFGFELGVTAIRNFDIPNPQCVRTVAKTRKNLDTYEGLRIFSIYEPLRRLYMAPTNQPTPAELEILDVLWDLKKGTVREIYEVISARRSTTYTTVLKFMQIMQAKGLVVRDEKAKAHIYRPKSSQQHTQKKLVGTLLDKAFRGSALSLVQHVLETKPTTREELAQIRRLIDEAEAKGGTK